ncbi:uncharacterized protein LOC113370940 [Ctenocephalides felis]|uniref:uncharacterized protein LOC113370940 n=1 Tax=Ctenocephalides felis TaxID=7515 RepID=UPI000E6E30E0|nr:uncharacterized protein LOC113370940 [Ctenocephalides felis]
MNSSQSLNKTDVNGDQMNGEVVNGDVCENGVKLGADMQYDGSRMTNPRTPPVRPERPEVKRRSRTKQLFHYSSARSADEPISIPINSIDNRKIIDMRFDKAERAEVLSNGAEATSMDHRWDERSSKSLEFERCSANSLRPTPPKKPLRLSLHRARSLQTVQSPVVPDQQNSVTDLYSKVDSKRPSKRTHNLAKRVLHQHIL